MKSYILIISLSIFSCLIGAMPQVTVYESHATKQATWKKVKGGKWPGRDGTWYKLSAGDYVLMQSPDGKKWEPVKDKKWQDKGGEWLMLKGRRLVWSVDGLKGWAEVPEWKWVATDGKWYKFDKEWTLWVHEEVDR